MKIKNIDGFDNYTITEEGIIQNNYKKIIKQYLNNDGYFVVNLYKDGKSYHRRVNRLIAEAFIPNPDNKPIVNHIDHNRSNNALWNLEWVTHKENSQQSLKNFPHRWKMNCAIDYTKAHEICKYIQEGYRNKEIADLCNVGIDVVKHIRQGNTWTEVSSHYIMHKSRRAISESTAKWICYEIKNGLTNKQILKKAKSDNISLNIVKAIRAKKTWKRISKDIL